MSSGGSIPTLTETNSPFLRLAAMWIFEMPAALAISLGFILAAVSPAVVVVGMFDLQKAGYGVLKGIPSLVVAAANW